MTNIINVPKHVAVIPDGNRRWAKKRLAAPWVGHQKGSEILNDLVDVVIDFKIAYVTFWGSSKDNMTKRTKEEVRHLLQIFKTQFLSLSTNEKIHKNEIKINILGSWREQFPQDVKNAMEEAIQKTKNYNKFCINFMIAYSGTDEILSAVKKMIAMGVKQEQVDGEVLKQYLLSADLPTVDLLIRTGGEPHNSDGFMMWDTANSQLFFLDKLWPEVVRQDFIDILHTYSQRDRRMGK